MKLRNGSYRDYTPTVSAGIYAGRLWQGQYGPDFWDKTAGEAAAFKGLFYPLQKAIKRNAGISFESFHIRALNYFQNQLPDKPIPVRQLYGKKMPHFVADELFPQFTDSNHLIFLNSSYRLPPEFVMQETGEKN